MINTLAHKLKSPLTWMLPPVEEARNELLLWLLPVGGISTVKMEECDMSVKMPEHHLVRRTPDCTSCRSEHQILG